MTLSWRLYNLRAYCTACTQKFETVLMHHPNRQLVLLSVFAKSLRLIGSHTFQRVRLEIERFSSQSKSWARIQNDVFNPDTKRTVSFLHFMMIDILSVNGGLTSTFTWSYSMKARYRWSLEFCSWANKNVLLYHSTFYLFDLNWFISII